MRARNSNQLCMPDLSAVHLKFLSSGEVLETLLSNQTTHTSPTAKHERHPKNNNCEMHSYDRRSIGTCSCIACAAAAMLTCVQVSMGRDCNCTWSFRNCRASCRSNVLRNSFWNPWDLAARSAQFRVQVRFKQRECNKNFLDLKCPSGTQGRLGF